MGLFRLFGKSPEQKLFESKEWKHEVREIGIYQKYQAELEPISKKYYSQLEKIQNDWSVMYNLKDFSGVRAKRYEMLCRENIVMYKQMVSIDQRYGGTSPPNAPGFKRLAMLYEKQSKFEDAASVCMDALEYGAWGDNMQSRLVRMIKKSGRKPNAYELSLIDKEFCSKN